MNPEPKPDIKFITPSLLDGLSEYLKNPANYSAIQKKILNTFMSTCSHGDVMEWANCPKCTKKMLARRKMLKELGFKNPAQYFAWKRVHEEISKKFPLMDWKTMTPLKL